MTRLRAPMLPTYYLLLLVLLYVPIGVLFLFSINDAIAFTFPLKGLTAHWYVDMFNNADLLRALRNSAVVAFGSSFVATLLGTATAIALVRFDFKGKAILLGVALLPLIVPFLILGVSLLILFAALDIERSLVTVTVAHSVVSLPYTLLIMMSRLVGFDASLEEAAQDLGATYPYILARVILPLIAPAIVASWLVAFTISFDEFVLASFLSGRTPTLPVYIFGQLRFALRFPQVVALAVVVMLISITLFLMSERLQRIGASATLAHRLGQSESSRN